MKEEQLNFPATRSWRELSQSVKPRAMSRGGRFRLVMAGVRTLALVVFSGGLAWGAWTVVTALQHDRVNMPAAAKAVPLKAPELETNRDGVLDNAWLKRTLRLPAGISLMELDLALLQSRVAADRQVLTASVTRNFPDRLKVKITERAPIARMRVDDNGVKRDLVAARDGVAFPGTGYDPAMLASLPWLDGVAVVRDGLAFRTVADLAPVARLLADAQFSASHLYETWQTVSLARLAADREIEVTTKRGTTAVFSAKGENFLQLAKLDYIVDRLARVPHERARINLSLGREVPVTVEQAPQIETRTPVKPGATTGASPFLSSFSRPHSKIHREL